MTKEEYIQTVSEYRKHKQKLINDTYLWVKFSINSLKMIAENDIIQIKEHNWKVPSLVEGKTIKRSPDEIRKIVKNAADKEIYFAIFTYIVALFESFLVDTISLSLGYDTRKLKINIQGSENNRKLEIGELLECQDYDQFIKMIITRQVGELFYAGPKKQVEYIEKILKIEIDKELWEYWFEFKATRDVIVHNSGIINKIYLDKVGKKSRGEIGHPLTISKEYFEGSCSKIKSLIGKIEAQAKKNS